MLWSIDSFQNRVSADQYHLTVSRAQVSTHLGWLFLEVILWHVTGFQMIAGSSSIFVKFIWDILCLCAAQLKFWFQTDLGCENSASYYRQGRQFAFDSSHHGHALVTLSVQFLFSDWSVRFNRKSTIKLVYCSMPLNLLLYRSHFRRIISYPHLKHTANKPTCAWEFRKLFFFCFITLRCIQTKINEQFPFIAIVNHQFKTE